jgi:hypothetical protein
MSLGHVRLVLLAILLRSSSHIRNVEHRVALHICRRSVQTRDVKSRLVLLYIFLLASSMFFISMCQRLIDSLYLASLVLQPIQTIVLHHLTLTNIQLRAFKHPNLLRWNVLLIRTDCLMALLCRPILTAAIEVIALILICIIDVVD